MKKLRRKPTGFWVTEMNVQTGKMKFCICLLLDALL